MQVCTRPGGWYIIVTVEHTRWSHLSPRDFHVMTGKAMLGQPTQTFIICPNLKASIDVFPPYATCNKIMPTIWHGSTLDTFTWQFHDA